MFRLPAHRDLQKWLACQATGVMERSIDREIHRG
jgi:hypothetical protein